MPTNPTEKPDTEFKKLEIVVSPGKPFDPDRAAERRKLNGNRDSSLRP